MKIYYEVHGNGYPIVLLHGNQENRKIYDQLIKAINLSQWIHVIMVNLLRVVL